MTRLLHQWVTQQAHRRPDAMAVTLKEDGLTYGALETLSNQIAHALRGAGCRRGDRVGLWLPKSPKTVAGMLGVLKADACYVPLDVSSPAPRLAKILDRAEPRVILVGSRGAGTLEALLRHGVPRAEVAVGWLDDAPSSGQLPLEPAFTLEEAGRLPPESPVCRNSDQDLAHLLFTSGSTGVPKGVQITHRSVISFVEWATAYFGLAAGDHTSGHSPFHFDLSTFDVFGTLAAGAQLHLVPPEFNVLPHKLVEFMRRQELTQWFSVPSVLSLMAQLDVVRRHDLPALRRLLWCGEVFPTPALRYWMSRLPHVRFTNLYGPTEATIASSYYTMPACPGSDTDAIPIGRPCAGEELLVLDRELKPVATGESGELYIRGAGLSPGYWRDPDKTAAAFLADPARPGERLYRTGDLARVGPDGLVYYLGREDSQIKSRGYRIELGEIEAALHTLPDLEECAVIALPSDGFEGTTICCGYVPRAGAALAPLDLRRRLGALLPAYMVPSQWRAFARLPRNANGKIDRRRIKEEWSRDEAAPIGQA